jgi:hypothetical protein
MATIVYLRATLVPTFLLLSTFLSIRGERYATTSGSKKNGATAVS